MLVFVDDIRTELDLVRYGNWFSQGRGVVTVCKLLVGDLMAEPPEITGRLISSVEVHHADIVLLPFVTRTVDGAAGGTATTSDETGAVDFEPGSFVDGAGDPYAAEFLFVGTRYGVYLLDRSAGTWGRATTANGLVDEDGESVDFRQSFAAKGHIADLALDDLFFLDAH